MALTQPQRTALEAAILAYVTAQGASLARTAAAFAEEAQFHGGEAVQTTKGGAVLQSAWQRTGLEAATLAYLTAQGGRFARTVATFTEEAQCRGRQRMRTRSSDVLLENAWASFLEKRNFNNMDELFCAIQDDDLAEVHLFVWIGIDVETQRYLDDHQVPPLVWAAFENKLDIVNYFVELGHDKDAVDLEGVTPLMTSCGQGHADIAEYLLDQGCDRDHVCNNGWTALHCAAFYDRLDVAQVLFRYGAKLDVRDNNGDTPTDIATHMGHHAFADAVRAEEIRRRDHGFKRDRSTIEGTEEHEAAKRPRVEAVEEEAVDESDDDDDDDDDEEES